MPILPYLKLQNIFFRTRICEMVGNNFVSSSITQNYTFFQFSASPSSSSRFWCEKKWDKPIFKKKSRPKNSFINQFHGICLDILHWLYTTKWKCMSYFFSPQTLVYFQAPYDAIPAAAKWIIYKFWEGWLSSDSWVSGTRRRMRQKIQTAHLINFKLVIPY